METSGDSNGGICCRPCRPRSGGSAAKAVLGIGLLALGALLTLDNLHLLDAERYMDLWPLLLVVFGITHILQPAPSRRIGSGLVWITIGVLILLYNLAIIDVEIWDFWPVLLILVGGKLLWRALFRARRQLETDAASTFDATAVLGGVERRISTRNFQGGEATAIMGGCEIDLRDAGSEGDPAVINVFSVWGGIEIRVPEDWEVQVEGTAIMGAFEDKSRTTADNGSKLLIIRGLVLMAGVEITN
jgi:predicted membrane protein